MKKIFSVVLLFIAFSSPAQKWIAEVSPGIMIYRGDLTGKGASFKNLKPGIYLNLKYDGGYLMNLRGGVGWGMLGADDKNNSDPTLSVRNLNFKTHLFEINAIAEFNIVDPDYYTSYPYLFGGIGLFYFNPYTFDKQNKKTFLHPLSTEGQGLTEFPDRKKYSLTQFCIPFGAGWKWKTKNDAEISFEFGYRFTFTDYLDDVSKTYVDLEVLAAVKGQESADLSYRTDAPFNLAGERRGNSGKKDLYFFSGLKFSFEVFKKGNYY